MAKTRSKPPAEAAGPTAGSDRVTAHMTGSAASSDLAREAVIRLHAYRLWERRGGREGHAMDDWLQAEAEFAHLGGHAEARLSGPAAEDAR